MTHPEAQSGFLAEVPWTVTARSATLGQVKQVVPSLAWPWMVPQERLQGPVRQACPQSLIWDGAPAGEPVVLEEPTSRAGRTSSVPRWAGLVDRGAEPQGVKVIAHGPKVASPLAVGDPPCVPLEVGLVVSASGNPSAVPLARVAWRVPKAPRSEQAAPSVASEVLTVDLTLWTCHLCHEARRRDPRVSLAMA